MPINALNVVMTVKPVVQPCPPAGKQFVLDITVTGMAAGGGGNYDLYVYDEDWGPDTVLDSLMNNAVAKNGKFKDNHKISLKCDDNCHVAGALRTSGENTTDVYAYVESGNVNATSGKWTLTCGSAPSPDDESIERRERLAQQTARE